MPETLDRPEQRDLLPQVLPSPTALVTREPSTQAPPSAAAPVTREPSSQPTTSVSQSRSVLPRVLWSYQKKKEGSEIVNRWHAANKKSDEKAKKAKSQEKPPTSSDSRSSGFSTPHTDTVHNKVLAADGLPDLEDAPLEFAYGKDLLLSWILCDCPTYTKRMHNW